MSDRIIDWQSLVDFTKGLLLKEALKFVMGKLITIPYVGWALNNFITRWLVEWVVKQVIDSLDTTLFKLNMDLLKTDQFKDYRERVAAVISAPPDISDADWEALEDEANDAFRRANRLIV